MLRRNLLLLATILCLPLAVHGGEAEKFFTERSKDFGTVPFGPALVHHFKVTNTSDRTITISGASVSCGCVTPTVQAHVIKPGEHTFVTASMDTKRFVGHKEVTVFVSFGNPREQVTLSVKANRNDNFSMSAEHIAMGQVRKGQTGTGTLQVTMRGDPRFQVSGSSTSTDFVKAEFSETSRTAGEVTYTVKATLRPGLDVGLWTADMTFTTSSATVRTIRVPVVVEVVAPITATPALVQFPAVKVGEQKEMSVVVKGEKPFKILDIKGGDGLVTAAAESTEAKQAHVVRLVFKPSGMGDLDKTLTVTTDDGSASKVTIPVRGKVRPGE